MPCIARASLSPRAQQPRRLTSFRSPPSPGRRIIRFGTDDVRQHAVRAAGAQGSRRSGRKGCPSREPAPNQAVDRRCVRPSPLAALFSDSTVLTFFYYSPPAELEEDGVRIALTIVDTPGFGDLIDNSPWPGEILDYLEKQYDETLAEESRIKRNPRFKDNRVHGAYFRFRSGSRACQHPLTFCVSVNPLQQL